MNPDGTDTATAGSWQRANPAGTWSDGPKQLDVTTSGSRDLATGTAAGAAAGANDVDGGTTTARSSPITLPASPGPLTFRFSFAHDAASGPEDWLRVWIEDAAGTRTLVMEELGAAENDDAAWASARITLEAWAGQAIRIVVGAADEGADGLVEAALDDVRVERP